MTSSDHSGTRAGSTLPLDWARQTGKVDVVLRNLEGKLQKKRRRRRTAAAAITVVAVLACTVFLVVPFVRDTNTIATASAHRQTLELADGSHADLNARTNVHSDFRYGRRLVRLDQGEVFFSVAKDKEHPFLVETPAGTVRVTGTKFNVRLEEGGAVEVTLLEGSVEIQASAPASRLTTTHLSPGQQFASARTGLRTLSPTEIENTISWRTGRLALDGLTLGEAAARFATYHGKSIAVAPSVAALSLGGSCPLDDLPGFLSFLKEAFPVHVLAQGEDSYRIVAK
jgi:transmembrane sensor